MSAFLLLWREALLDALRRKLVAAIAVASLLSLMVLRGCSGCAPAINVNGQVQDVASAAPVLGMVLLIVVGLWVVTLAGLLAADHLTQSLEDGHAAAALARPVRRHELAFARLAGSLTISLATGALLLGMTAFWLVTGKSLAAGPAVLALLACAPACIAVAAFSMAASLALPRIAIWFLVFGTVFATTMAALAALSGAELGGTFGTLLAAIDRFGLPIAGAMLRALAPWLPGAQMPADFAAVFARSVLWAAGGLATLALAFRRIELK
jgi:hypothetical protein